MDVMIRDCTQRHTTVIVMCTGSFRLFPGADEVRRGPGMSGKEAAGRHGRGSRPGTVRLRDSLVCIETYSAANTRGAPSSVSSMTASLCAMDTKPASKADGAR